MSLTCGRLVPRLAVAGVVLAALVLSACGRKSGLDAPPSASRSRHPQMPPRRPSRPPQSAQDEWGADRPVAPKGPNKRIPLDVLLD